MNPARYSVGTFISWFDPTINWRRVSEVKEIVLSKYILEDNIGGKTHNIDYTYIDKHSFPVDMPKPFNQAMQDDDYGRLD